MGIKSTNQTEKLYKTNHPTYSTVEITTKIAKKKGQINKHSGRRTKDKEGEPVDYKKLRPIIQLQSTDLVLYPSSNKHNKKKFFFKITEEM